jgi:hypothetical protein
MTTTPDQAAAWDRKFYDNAGYVFPDDATHIMVYADGWYGPGGVEPPPPDLHQRYPYIHHITVTGETWQAQFADYELGNPVYGVPGRARAWVEARINRGLRAVPYCDRADLHRLAVELGPTLWKDPRVRFWIPTLDGRQWSPAVLSQNIALEWGVYIPPDRIWANQYAGTRSGSGGPWDTSNLFGTWD